MKQKLYIIIIIFLFSGLKSFAQAPDFSGLKIMINPGHGGNDSNDRGMPNGFWESESNLTKGLWLRDLLEARGSDSIIMSRVLNRTEDDLPLSQIAAMANANQVDLFISIHSNASNQSSNFPLTIFNGKSETPTIPEAKVWARILWEHLITNKATHWTSTIPHYIGDLTLNPSWTSGYGVLWPLQVPGIISEGSFHDYQPEVDRLLNLEYRKQEAWNIMYAMTDYFQLPGRDETGNITGIIRDSLLLNVGYTIQNSPDRFLPVNGSKVEILETGEQYLVDQQNTGFYYFDSISPGDYHLIFSAPDYFTDTVLISVNPHQHNHLNYWLRADKTMAPKIVGYSPADGGTIECFDPLQITFNMNMDAASFPSAFSISPQISGSFSWDDEFLNVSFQPDIPYETNTEYTVFIDSTAEHQWGVSLDTTLEFSFTTGNRNRFILESSFPAGEQQNVSPYLQFRLFFDAPLNSASLINAINIIASDGSSMTTKGAKILSVDDKGHYYFSAASDLNFDEDYVLQILGSIKDVNNIPVVDTIKIAFHTMTEIINQVIIDEFENTPEKKLEWSLDLASSVQTEPYPSSFVYHWPTIYRSGTGSLLLRYLFLDESAYCLIKPLNPVQLIESIDKLSFWLWGEMSENSLLFGFDNDIEVDAGIIDFAGWNFLTIDIPAGATALEYIKLSANPGSVLSGDIFFDALSQAFPVGVPFENSSNPWNVFPNPLLGNSLNINGLQASTKYSIYSIDGKLLQFGSVEKSQSKIELNEEVLRQSLFLFQLTDHKYSGSQLIINAK
ncbi:MAG: N-acetylmuramoyl-L-alanine amidase [Bacteroidales bacterium]|nr:N-acetylmuramoyl-L-alanine amidase [Bacteroidales bacterium]MCF8391145.1 N-acetylmuramoyl-L-alanine amidase [Bacteroidales bacterium]